jgi:hypothetical protein
VRSALEKWQRKLAKVRYEEQRARKTFPRKMTVHEEIVLALCANDPTVWRSGFYAALNAEIGAVFLGQFDDLDPDTDEIAPDDTDESFLEDCFGAVKGMIPDAYRINTEAQTVTIFEVEDTYGLTWKKLDRYLDLFWVLDNESWELEIVVVDRAGHARHTDVTLLAHDGLAKKPRGKRPVPWLQPKIHDARKGPVPSLTAEDYTQDKEENP